MKLIDNLNDMYLRKHVKSLLERFYLMQGINIKDLEKKTNKELIDLLKQYLDIQNNKVNELEMRNSSMMKVIGKQDECIKTLEKTNDDLYDRNERLVKQIYERNEYMKPNELESVIGKDNKQGLEVV